MHVEFSYNMYYVLYIITICTVFVDATVAVQCLCIVLVSMVIAYIYTYRTIDFLLALTLVPTGKVYKLISLKAV